MRYVTVGTVARMLGCAPRTIYKLLRAGKLRGYRLDTGESVLHRRIEYDSIVEFAAASGIHLVSDNNLTVVVTASDRVIRQFDGASRVTSVADFLLDVSDINPARVVFDAAFTGRADACVTANSLRKRFPFMKLAVIPTEDEINDRELLQFFHEVIRL